MAEYVEVMNQKRRMCNSYALCSMGCPLKDIDFCNKNSGEKTNADFPEVERRTMAWAAEHPEPVYPTWWEYLIRFGVTGMNQPDHSVIYKLKNWRVPADIAEKPGLEPKEDRT